MTNWEAIINGLRKSDTGSDGYRVLFRTITESIEKGALPLFNLVCLTFTIVAIFVSR